MGKLADLLNKRTKEVQQETQPVQDTSVKKYNRIWLKKMADTYKYEINEEGGKVDGILGALNRKDGHCPCGGNGDQFLCPCINMREHGLCKCGLYHNIDRKNPSGTSTVSAVRRN